MDDRIVAPPPGFIRTEPFSTLSQGAEIPEGFEIAPPPGFHKPVAPPTQEEALQEAINDLPDPAEERAGMENAQSFGYTMGITARQAYDVRDEIAKEFTGDPTTTQRNFWQKLGDAVVSGAKTVHSGLQAGILQDKLNTEAFEMSMEVMVGKWDKGRFNRMMQLEEQIVALVPEGDISAQTVLFDVGQIIPGIIEGMKEGTLYGLGTAAIGAAAGAPVGGVGAGPGAAGGFLFGLSGGIASHAFKQMRGQSWLTLTRMKDEEGNPMPQAIVQILSLAAGAVNAAIEVVQISQIMKTIPGVKKAFQKASGEAFEKMIEKGTFRQIALNHLQDYGEYWIKENLEELAQETVDIMSEHVAIELSNKLTGTEFNQATFQDELSRLTDTFIHSGPALAILGAPGHIGGGSLDIATLKRRKALEIRSEAEVEGVELSEEEVQKQIEEQLFGGTEFEGVVDEVAISPYWYDKSQRGQLGPERIAEADLKFVEPSPEIKEVIKESRIVEIEGEKYSRKEVRRARDEAREIKVSELVGELETLKTGTRKRVVGKAFTAGKEAGVAQQKKAKREAKLKDLARREQRNRLNRIIKDLKKVQSKLPVMSEEHTAPIRELIDGLDFTKHRKSTMIGLEKTRQYLEKNPEAEISESLKERLETLDKRSIRDLSMDEVEDIYTAVMHHAHLEKGKQEIRIGIKYHNANLVILQAMNEMKAPKKTDTEIVSSKITPAEKVKEVGRKLKNFFGLRHNHYDLIIENLSGPNSTMDKVLFTGVKEGITDQLRYRQETFRAFQKDLEKEVPKKKNVDKWLNERVKVGKFDLTRNERMEIYNHFLNEDNRDSMLAEGIGLKYGSDPNQVYSVSNNELTALMNSLTPEERAFADKPVSNLFEKQYDRLNKVFKEKNGYELPKEEIYFPKDVMPISRGTDIEKESALEQFTGQWTRVGLEKGMLERRRRVTKPIYIHGLTKVINKSVMNSAAYIGLELPLGDASKLLYNKNFREQMILRYDKETWGEIEKGLRDIAGEWRSYTDFEEALLKLRTKMSTAMLGLDPFIMVKQPLSYAMYSVYVKPKYLLQGIVDYMVDGKNVVERHKLYSPEYQERLAGGFSRDVGEVVQKAGPEKRLYGGKTKLPEKMMAGIKWFDKQTVTPGMQGAVLQVLDELQSGKLSDEVSTALDIRPKDISKLTAEEKMQLAYKFADWTTNRTQPTFAVEHRSSLSRGTPIEKMATQFSSFTNQALNLLRRTLTDAKDTKSKAAVKRATKAFLAVMVVNTVGISLVNELRDLVLYDRREREKRGGLTEKMITSALKSVTGMFYVVRDLAGSAMSKIQKGTFTGYDVSLPVMRAANLFTDVAAHGFRMFSHPSKRQRQKEALQFIDDSVELTLMMNGLPFSKPKRMVERVIEEVKD